MKTLITGIALQLATGFAGAFNHQSELNISGTGKNLVSVSLDNSPFMNYQRSVDFASVEPGHHYLVVYKREFVRLGNSFNHKKFIDKIVYNGYIEIPAASFVTGIADHFDGLTVSVDPLYDNHFYNNHPVNTVYTPLPVCMNPAAFSELKNVIANRWFDSTKLQVAKQAVASNPVSSAQLAELMDMMSFESSKLELAKAGYAYVIDRQNFFIVNNSFTFESSIAELEHYIRNT
jgi:hypothetical protein